MPTYQFFCRPCGIETTFVARIDARNEQKCVHCGSVLERGLAAPLFKFAGRVTKGGGPDRFTADALGIPLKDLPEGLRAEPAR